MRAVVGALFAGLVGGGLAITTEPAQAILGVDSCTFISEATGHTPANQVNPLFIAAEMVTPIENKRSNGSIDPATSSVFELLRGQGQSWSTYGRTIDDSAGCNIMDQAQSMMAVTVLFVADSLSGVAILVYVVATNGEGLLNMLLDKVDSPARKLGTTFFQPMSIIMMMIVGLYIGVTHAVKKKGIRQTLSDTGGAIGMVIVVAVFVGGGWYITLVKEVDKFVAGTQSAVTSLVLSGNSEEDSPCSVPGGDIGEGRRQMACQMWHAMSFTPWALGQYGSLGTEPIPYSGEDFTEGRMPSDFRYQQLWAQTYSINDMAAVREVGDKGEIFELTKTKNSQWKELAEHARKSANNDEKMTASERAVWAVTYNSWRGEGSGSRFTTAFNAAGTSIISSIATTWMSVLNLVYQQLPVLLLLALTIIALMAMFPKTKWIFSSWTQLLAKSFLLRLITGITLALLLFVLQIIIEMNESPFLTGLYQLVIAISLIILFRMAKKAIPQNDELSAEAKNTTSDTMERTTSTVSSAVDAKKGGGGVGGMLLAAGGMALLGKRAGANGKGGSSGDAEEKGRKDREENEERDSADDADTTPKTGRRQKTRGSKDKDSDDGSKGSQLKEAQERADAAKAKADAERAEDAERARLGLMPLSRPIPDARATPSPIGGATLPKPPQLTDTDRELLKTKVEEIEKQLAEAKPEPSKTPEIRVTVPPRYPST